MLRPHVSGRALTALACFTLSFAPRLAAQSGSVIRGRILDPAGHGIAGALVVRTSPTADTSHADSAGHYALDHLAPGRYVFQFRKAGYDPMEMELTLVNDTTLDVDVPLQQAAGSLSAPGKLEQVGFNRRREENRHRRGVRYIGPAEIAAAGATRITDLLRGIQDIEVRSISRYTGIIGDGNRCAMPVYIEGQQATNFWPYADRGLDDVLSVDQVAGIEVYPRDSQVPQQFVRPIAAAPATYTSISGGSAFVQYDTHTVHCGVIAIWTN